MNTHRRIATTIIITSFGLLLTACVGFSGNKMMDTDTGMTGDTDTGMTGDTDTGMTGDTDTGMTGDTDTGMTGGEPKVLHDLAGNGLFTADGASFTDDARNPASGSFADSSADSTEYSPLTTAISIDYDENVSAIATDFFMTSIIKTGAGLEINYMVGDEAMSVTMTSADCFLDPAPYISCEKDGAYLWSMTSIDPTEFDQGDEFQHMEVQHLLAHGYRTNYLFGVNPQTLPSGSATYAGRLRADAFKMTSAHGDQRVRYSGAFLLSANFDMSELNGRIHAIRGSQPGQSSSSDRVSWPTSYFTITDGRIVNGQFTAVLTAGDSDPNTPFNESVRGYMGHILGEFFGPNAEEVGAVVSASRDVAGEEHDYVLYGFIGGTDFGPSKTLGSAGLLAGNQRDFTAMTTELQDDDGMATVERIENGWQVNFDGRMFELLDVDLVSDTYIREVSNGVTAYLWTRTRGFQKNSEFNHFDVKGWAIGEFDSQGDPMSANYTYIVHGNRTPGSAMPTSGTATYDGRMEALEASTNEAVESLSTSATFYFGDVTLTADFAASDVAGNFTNLLRSQTGVYGPYDNVSGGATFNADINGNGMTADNLSGIGALSGYQNGNVRGAFFGPSAEEAAGVFDAQDQTANKVLTGWFGTAKDE